MPIPDEFFLDDAFSVETEDVTSSLKVILFSKSREDTELCVESSEAELDCADKGKAKSTKAMPRSTATRDLFTVFIPPPV